MNDFTFLDSIWKCLLGLTISTSVIFILCSLIQLLVKKFISSNKSKWFFNYHVLFVVGSVFGASTILLIWDPELTNGCFDHFVVNSDFYVMTRLLAGGYVTGLLFLLLGDGAFLFIANRKQGTLAKIDSHIINEILEELKRYLKINVPVEILFHKESASPYVWGLFKHSLVVNPFLLGLKDRNKIKAILSHELIHVRDHDSVWLMTSHFLKRIFYFHPFIYWLYTRHKNAIEMAADEMAIEQCGIEPSLLVNSILEIAEACVKSRDHLLRLNMSQEFMEMEERIHSLMVWPKATNRGWIYPSVLLGSLALSLVVTTVQTNASVGVFGGVTASSKNPMCSQIRQEEIIRNWLQIESASNKCKMNGTLEYPD